MGFKVHVPYSLPTCKLKMPKEAGERKTGVSWDSWSTLLKEQGFRFCIEKLKGLELKVILGHKKGCGAVLFHKRLTLW